MNFPTTNWTLLAEATLRGESSQAKSLSSLLEQYRPPVVHFLRQRGNNPQESDDLAQDLFLELLQSQAWRRVDRTKGRFRSFLLGVLMHVITRERRRNCAEKRGAGHLGLSLDELGEEGIELESPRTQDVELYDRQWALQLVNCALTDVETKYLASGKQHEWHVLVRFLPGAGEVPTYESAAADLAMKLPTLKSTVHRIRQQFRESLRQAVARTVSAAHEIDDELAYLHRVLCSPGL